MYPHCSGQLDARHPPHRRRRLLAGRARMPDGIRITDSCARPDKPIRNGAMLHNVGQPGPDAGAACCESGDSERSLSDQGSAQPDETTASACVPPTGGAALASFGVRCAIILTGTRNRRVRPGGSRVWRPRMHGYSSLRLRTGCPFGRFGPAGLLHNDSSREINVSVESSCAT